MRKIWLAGLLAVVAAPAAAHDFWIQAHPFDTPIPNRVLLTIQVGHAQFRDRWGVDASHVVAFHTIGPDGDIDRKSDLRLGSPGYDAIISLDHPGSYIMAMQSTQSPSQLPFLRFNDYVTFEGISPIIEQRKRLHQERADGRELYSRRAKTLLQVGPVDAASIARVTRPVGLSLEIVPEKHPLALGADRVLPLHVLFNGRPLGGATVKLTNLDADAEPVEKEITGRDGRTAMHIPKPGKWQLNVIWSAPIHDPRADFATTFSSFAFEIPK